VSVVEHDRIPRLTTLVERKSQLVERRDHHGLAVFAGLQFNLLPDNRPPL